MVRILIADDHAIVRRGLRHIIHEEYPFAEIGEASDAEELVKKVIAQNWDVVICDLNMPGRSGIDAVKQIRQSFSKLPILIMSVYPEDQYAIRSLKAGAAGYLSKVSIHYDLIKAIQTVLNGKKFITPAIAEKVLDAFSNEHTGPPHESLSDREFEVFKLLATGKTISEIAHQLSLSGNTVSTYRSRVLDKMHLQSNADMTRYALERKLI
ncbi:response regulator transcription factor [Danxiaibacter flavus]|uniref:Response regulator transcription factor n=1 Tax=Danxiaibacter flavus TaxID=3049108 RepID=A0ABV3ZKJ3_9BACT|nr:response regulator transcription factor [Chitinophagaceae bacterium DXS]